jgi:hypothetical protein
MSDTDMVYKMVRDAMKEEGVSLYIIVQNSQVKATFYAFSDEDAARIAGDRPLYKRVERD